MIIYIVYQKFYADFENGEDDIVYIDCAYKSRRRAIKEAKAEINKEKNLYIDKNIKNKKNPFKHNRCVDFYKEEYEQKKKVSSIIMEEVKLIA